MMKKIYLTVISLAFLLASCNKWLDINPELEIRNDDMYSMEQGFMDVLTGAYIRMATPSLYGCNTTVRLPELMANHWSVASTSTGTVEDYVTRFDFYPIVYEEFAGNHLAAILSGYRQPKRFAGRNRR